MNFVESVTFHLAASATALGADDVLLHLLNEALGNKDEVDILWVDTDELEEDEDDQGF